MEGTAVNVPELRQSNCPDQYSSLEESPYYIICNINIKIMADYLLVHCIFFRLGLLHMIMISKGILEGTYLDRVIQLVEIREGRNCIESVFWL